jgi:N-acetylmuramoyl-L-alanine amidase
MQSAQAALARLSAPEFEVSAHYLISQLGEITQLVAEQDRAWHAGAGAWGECCDINSHSIGIELDNTGEVPFSAPQMAALEGLMTDVMARRNIPPERVIGHSDMAPLRKGDPGARFDWRRLALGGRSVWPQSNVPCSAGISMQDFLVAARTFGYPTDVEPEAVLGAFRLRFRPSASGAVDAVDLGLISDLAQRFPVDQTTPKP